MSTVKVNEVVEDQIYQENNPGGGGGEKLACQGASNP